MKPLRWSPWTHGLEAHATGKATQVFQEVDSYISLPVNELVMGFQPMRYASSSPQTTVSVPFRRSFLNPFEQGRLLDSPP